MTDLPLVSWSATMADAMRVINQDARGVALVVDDRSHLIDAITDGDVRRAILAGMGPLDLVMDVVRVKGTAGPITATVGTDPAELRRLMREHHIRQVPLIDSDGRVVDLAVLDETGEPPVPAVILAGGLGTRLRPLTDNCPKPMLPIGGRPLLEITLERLRDAGVRRVHLAVRHQSEQIMEHFGDGQRFGVDVRYVREDEPLGTAGCLGLIAPADGPILITNADLLTTVDYSALLAYHYEQQADLTVVQSWWEAEVPYGVLEQQGGKLKELIEKPMARVPINAGIYLLQPYVQHYIPPRPCHMTQVVGALLKMRRPIAVFPLLTSEYWRDIGRATDYAQAQEDANNGMVR